MKRSKIFRTLWRPRLIVWLATLLMAGWLLSSLPLTGLRLTLAAVQPAWLLGLAAFNAFVMLFFISRWWLILRALGYRIPYLSALRYRTAAFSISYFTPGPQFGGEPLQIYALQSRHAVPGAVALASVTLDKLFDLLANFTFLAIGVTLILYGRLKLFQGLFAGFSPTLAVLWIGGLAILPLAYLLALGTGHTPFTALLRRSLRLALHPVITDKATKASTIFAAAEVQVSALIRQQPRAVISVLLASGLIWLLSLCEYGLALRVLGGRLDLFQTVAALTIVRISFLTPLPGGLGALEAGQVLAMQALGFGPGLGLAISLWIRARDIVLGLLGLWWGAQLTAKGSPALETIQPLPSQAGD
jgi:glycosyltransferase 2 family protein